MTGPPLIVTPEYSSLTFKSLKIEVHQERFDCKTFVRNNFYLIKDVILKIFSLLEHTPVKAVGINFEGHWKFSEDGGIILKRIFGDEKNKQFQDIFGNTYEIGGRISTTQEDYNLRIDYSESNILKGGIFFNTNYHRKVDSNRTEDALTIINNCYNKDLENIIQINIKLFGNPKETVTDE